MSILNDMLEGFSSYDAMIKNHTFNDEQTRKIKSLVSGIRHFQTFYQATDGMWYDPRKAGDALFNQYTDLKLQARGRQNCADDGLSLSVAEVNQFEREGVLGPYQVLSESDTKSLHQHCYRLFENDFNGNTIFDQEQVRMLKETGAWRIPLASLYQGLHDERLWDVLSSTKITKKLACLLGDDIICWRSQMFETIPGKHGTFWHQTGTFTEASMIPKFELMTEREYGMVQLTVWVALTDVTVENSCMRFLPGSFRDCRFEQFTNWYERNLPYFCLHKTEAEIEQMVKCLFIPHKPVRIFSAFEKAINYFDDLFSDYTPRDYEMKAGEFIVFTSTNMHASYPNVTKDRGRLALGGRYTTNDVKVLSGCEYDSFVSPVGKMQFSLENAGCMQVHGRDKYQFNKTYHSARSADCVNLN